MKSLITSLFCLLTLTLDFKAFAFRMGIEIESKSCLISFFAPDRKNPSILYPLTDDDYSVCRWARTPGKVWLTSDIDPEDPDKTKGLAPKSHQVSMDKGMLGSRSLEFATKEPYRHFNQLRDELLKFGDYMARFQSSLSNATIPAGRPGKDLPFECRNDQRVWETMAIKVDNQTRLVKTNVFSAWNLASIDTNKTGFRVKIKCPNNANLMTDVMSPQASIDINPIRFFDFLRRKYPYRGTHREFTTLLVEVAKQLKYIDAKQQLFLVDESTKAKLAFMMYLAIYVIEMIEHSPKNPEYEYPKGAHHLLLRNNWKSYFDYLQRIYGLKEEEVRAFLKLTLSRAKGMEVLVEEAEAFNFRGNYLAQKIYGTQYRVSNFLTFVFEGEKFSREEIFEEIYGNMVIPTGTLVVEMRRIKAQDGQGKYSYRLNEAIMQLLRIGRWVQKFEAKEHSYTYTHSLPRLKEEELIQPVRNFVDTFGPISPRTPHTGDSSSGSESSPETGNHEKKRGKSKARGAKATEGGRNIFEKDPKEERKGGGRK